MEGGEFELGGGSSGFDEGGAGEGNAEEGGGDGTADGAIEPVVVVRFGAELPLVDLTASAFGGHSVFGTEVFGVAKVAGRVAAPQGEAGAVAHRGEPTGGHKALPEVGVIDDMPGGAFAGDGGHHPVLPDAFAGLAAAFAHGLRGGTDVLAVARKESGGMWAFAAELVDHIGGGTPVGVDEGLVDGEGKAVLAEPRAGEEVVREGFETLVKTPFESCAWVVVL